MNRKDRVRADKLRQVARRFRHGSTKVTRMSPVRRAAEAEREYRRQRP